MQLKLLIKQLQDLYATYDDEYKSVMGEPEIVIDVFKYIGDHTFGYKGFSPNVHIEKTSDGVYDIISAFETDK